ncbi:MAG TPA: hypothetical protein VNJ01_02715 [Bacteriovoracaceae bacterium]|nr:hypothetical protein [Bacteriovoracaceae bacterium]
MERVVLETKEVMKVEGRSVVVPLPQAGPGENKSKPSAGPTDVLYSEDVTELAGTMEHEKQQYLEKELQVAPEKVKRHQRLKEDFFKASMKFDQEFPNQEPTLKQRRQLLDMEEKYTSDLEQLYGKDNWERFEKYRRRYNQQGLKKQREENQPFIFMTP